MEDKMGKGWRFINSLWIILAFVMFLNWTAFVYIGTRSKHKPWLIFGGIYFFIFAAFGINSTDFWTGAYAISWIICIIHAFFVRNRFLLMLEQRISVRDNNKSKDTKKTEIAKKPEPKLTKPKTQVVKSVEDSIIADGLKKVQELRELAGQIRENRLQIKLSGIINQANKIFSELKQNPEEISKVNRFLDYYLDTTLTIVAKYIKLDKQQSNNEEFVQVLKKFENTLDTIAIAFEKQMNRLLEDDLFDLEVEMSMLDKVVKSEEVR